MVLEVTGRVLRQALEQCASFFDRGADGSIRVSEHFLKPKEAYYNYDYFAGMEYAFDLRKPVGERVVSMRREGRDIGPEEKLDLVMCDYRATGAGDFDFYRDCPRVREVQTDVSELILDELRAYDRIEVPDSHPYTVIR